MIRKRICLGEKRNEETRANQNINGPVKSYFLSPEELERYKKMVPEKYNPKLGRPPGGGAA